MNIKTQYVSKLILISSRRKIAVHTTKILLVGLSLLSSKMVWAEDILVGTQNSVSLSPYTLFQNADHVVKTVILVLIAASIFSWIVWVAKVFEIRKKNKIIIDSLKKIDQQKNLNIDFKIEDTATRLIYVTAQDELKEASYKALIAEHSVKERVAASIDRIIASEKHHISFGTSFLATTGAIAPFVGLLGTVWGIMHSFVSIAQSNTTNLSVVAPGIAEALFATALGLFAAIPAVILYNSIIRSISRHSLLLEDSATAIMNLLSRDLEDLELRNISQKRQYNPNLVAG